MDTRTSRSIVAMNVPEQGHLHRMLPVVAGLCDLGVKVHFFAHESARVAIEQTRACFVDLYAGRDMYKADAVSIPGPIRCVGFAGYFGEDVIRQVLPFQPKLVIHDSFAVIGRVIALHLKIPRVNMLAGHNPNPTRILTELNEDGPILVSEQCKTAVKYLRDRHGLSDTSPFSYFMDSGADLNLYSEPPEFLPPNQRDPFQPLEFFGSYWPHGSNIPDVDFFPCASDTTLDTRVYISFGTAVWRDFETEATTVLETLATALAVLQNVRVLISLGGHDKPGLAASLTHRNVRVESYVNQIQILQKTSIFITHHGLNSTHEAIYHCVPMVSCPFFADQPALATRCQELGIAVPLRSAKGNLTVHDVHQVMARVAANDESLRARLAEARTWEIAVIDQRPKVLNRIIAMMD